ncbi:MAG: 30S ribosomal protein S8 [Candidatus Paceibacterota bacterium]
MNNTVIDTAIRIKNGYLARRPSVDARYSRITEQVLKILKNEGYIKDFSVKAEGNKKSFQIELLYKGDISALKDIKIISKPGRRIYKMVSELVSPLGGLGIAIVSTSQGVMKDKQARKKNIGGEVLLEVW